MVTVEDAVIANEMFEILMGEEVVVGLPEGLAPADETGRLRHDRDATCVLVQRLGHVPIA